MASGTTALRILTALQLFCAQSCPVLFTTAQDGFPQVFSNQTLKLKGPHACLQEHTGRGQLGDSITLCSQAQGEPPPGTQAVMVAIEKKTERPNLWGLWQRIETGIRCEFRLQKGAPSAEQKNVKDRLKTSGFVL